MTHLKINKGPALKVLLNARKCTLLDLGGKENFKEISIFMDSDRH
jgi:hypothetical protein